MGGRRTLGLAPALPGLLLVVIIVWALAAVLMLTGTLINAREIDDDVTLITGEVRDIDKDLDFLKLAEQTIDISGRINAAAQPLVPGLNQVQTAARSIDRRVVSINNRAQAINRTVRSIQGNVVSIQGNVTAIHRNVISINATVNSIGGFVATIGGLVGNIGGNVQVINRTVNQIFAAVGPVNAATGTSINATVGGTNGILARFQTLEPVTRSIDAGVAAINGRAQRGIELAGSLKPDFAGILTQVGFGITPTGPDHGNNIHGHANGIDCSPFINGIAPSPTSYCNR